MLRTDTAKVGSGAKVVDFAVMASVGQFDDRLETRGSSVNPMHRDIYWFISKPDPMHVLTSPCIRAA